MMAIIRVHASKGFWNTKGGYEFPLTLLTVGFALGLTGPGIYSVDHAIGLALPEPESFLVGIILVAIGVLLALGSAPLRGLVEHRAPERVQESRQPRP